jgi:hypothetical protein
MNRLHQRQQEGTVPRAELAAKELTIDHFTEAPSIKKVCLNYIRSRTSQALENVRDPYR